MAYSTGITYKKSRENPNVLNTKSGRKHIKSIQNSLFVSKTHQTAAGGKIKQSNNNTKSIISSNLSSGLVLAEDLAKDAIF